MTPLDLQDELCEEIRKILDGHLYMCPNGQRVPMHIYSQNIPVLQNEDDEDEMFPYVIVQLNSGDDNGFKDSMNTVRLVIVVGVFDDQPDQQGYRDAMSIYQKIYQRFAEDPNLNGKAVFSGEFHWANQQDDYYPYFFGACSLSFYIPAIRRKDHCFYE